MGSVAENTEYFSAYRPHMDLTYCESTQPREQNLNKENETVLLVDWEQDKGREPTDG